MPTDEALFDELHNKKLVERRGNIMTTKQERKNEMTHDNIIQASKQWVTQTRTWATTLREAMLTPWEGIYRENEITNVMFTPWLTMTRAAHDRWLDMYETQAHQMIERTHTMFNQIQQ
jgi:hypothetical protein